MKEISLVDTRLVITDTYRSSGSINNFHDALKVILDNFCDLDREYLFGINMSVALKPMNCCVVGVGSVDGALVSQREVFKTALISGAKNILIAHNHPSGNLTPSVQDIQTTERIKKSCDLLGLQLLDSVIFNYDKDIYSIMSEKLEHYENHDDKNMTFVNQRISLAEDTGSKKHIL